MFRLRTWPLRDAEATTASKRRWWSLFVWLLVLVQPILIYASRRRKGVVDVVALSFVTVNALYSVVAHHCFAVLACSGSVRTGVTVGTTSVAILPDGTTFTETSREAVIMR